MANTSIYAAFERLWIHVINALTTKQDSFASGATILSSYQYGDEFPENAAEGQFFLKTAEEDAELSILKAVYPVGSIYMSISNTNPNSLFGFGTWEQIQDTFLLAAGSNYAAGSTGGEATHKLTSSELPKLSGTVNFRHWGTGAPYTGATGIISSNGEISETSNGFSTNNTTDGYRQLKVSFGGDTAHNNMPPYLSVYVWKRVS